jgi:hypothetical protein
LLCFWVAAREPRVESGTPLYSDPPGVRHSPYMASHLLSQT